MDDRALILYQLALSQGMVRRCIDDMTDAEAGTRPNAKLAPVVWQVGHLALADVQFAGFAGTPLDVPLPNAYADLFRQGTGGASEYSPLTAVAKTFDGTHTALLRLAEKARLDTRLETFARRFRLSLSWWRLCVHIGEPHREDRIVAGAARQTPAVRVRARRFPAGEASRAPIKRTCPTDPEG